MVDTRLNKVQICEMWRNLFFPENFVMDPEKFGIKINQEVAIKVTQQSEMWQGLPF